MPAGSRADLQVRTGTGEPWASAGPQDTEAALAQHCGPTHRAGHRAPAKETPPTDAGLQRETNRVRAGAGAETREGRGNTPRPHLSGFCLQAAVGVTASGHQDTCNPSSVPSALGTTEPSNLGPEPGHLFSEGPVGQTRRRAGPLGDRGRPLCSRPALSPGRGPRGQGLRRVLAPAG